MCHYGVRYFIVAQPLLFQEFNVHFILPMILARAQSLYAYKVSNLDYDSCMRVQWRCQLLFMLFVACWCNF